MITLKYGSVIQLMRELKTIGAVNINHSRQRGLTGKYRMQKVCNEYSKLMDNQAIHATWDVFFGQLRVASC